MKKRILQSFMIVGAAAMLMLAVLLAAIAHRTLEHYVAPDVGVQMIADVFMHALPLILLAMAVMMGLCFLLANLLTRRILKPIAQMAA